MQGDAIDICLFGDCPTADVVIALDSACAQASWTGDGLPCHLRSPRPDDVPDGVGLVPSCTVRTSPEWPPGVYLIRVSTDGKPHPPTGFFVVRPLRRTADVLLVLSTNTYNAYNHFGGASTYIATDPGHDGPASQASFLRPLMPGFLERADDLPRAANVGPPSADLDYAAPLLASGLSYASSLTGWAARERVFARWADERDVRLDFAVDEDLDHEPDCLDGYRLVLIVGHSEYWSWGMRDTLESFVAKGGNVAFFGGNSCYWQVRYTHEGNAMIAHKGAWRNDPVLGTADERRLTGLWAHPKVGRPESELTGLSYAYGGMARMPGAVPAGSGGYTVYRPDHWCFEGTGLAYGDLFGATGMIVAYECDGCRFTMHEGVPAAKGEGGAPDTLEVLALSPASLWSRETVPAMARAGVHDRDADLQDLEVAADQIEGNIGRETLDRYRRGHAVMASYVRGGTVFNAGTTDWTYGLQAGDPVVERITRNVLDRLSRR